MRSENHFVREREILRTTYGLKIAGSDMTRYAHVGLESARADDTAVKSCIPGSGGSADGLSGFQEHEFGTKTPTAHKAVMFVLPALPLSHLSEPTVPSEPPRLRLARITVSSPLHDTVCDASTSIRSQLPARVAKHEILRYMYVPGQQEGNHGQWCVCCAQYACFLNF